jgi:hypothetical protein
MDHRHAKFHIYAKKCILIPGSIKKPDLDDTLIEQYCVVKYDGRPYPGIIQAVDADELEVNVMHCIGENRFFWPRMDDVLWYTLENVLTLIPPPEKLTRHFQIDKTIWEEIKRKLDM